MAPRVRDPEGTRGKLLKAGFEEIHAQGYTAASMDHIVERSGVTKGALYHHFGSKKALAQAILDGPIRAMVVDAFLDPLSEWENPIDGIQHCVRAKVSSVTDEQLACGCPLNNLAQELSGSDDDFQAQIDGLYEIWRDALADALASGQSSGHVRSELNAHEVATFLVSVLAGTAGFAKSARDRAVAESSTRVLCDFLDTLRA